MCNDFFRATYAGGMVGLGADVFAVWGYVMAHETRGTIELNPILISAALGFPAERVEAAISATPMLVKTGLFSYGIEGYPKSAKRERRVATRLPEDFELTPERKAYAIAKGVPDPENQMVGFKNHHKAHGKTMSDWDAAWRTWVGNVKKFGGRDQQQQMPNVKPEPFPRGTAR
jgi:hypothetical protein